MIITTAIDTTDNLHRDLATGSISNRRKCNSRRDDLIERPYLKHLFDMRLYSKQPVATPFFSTTASSILPCQVLLRPSGIVRWRPGVSCHGQRMEKYLPLRIQTYSEQEKRAKRRSPPGVCRPGWRRSASRRGRCPSVPYVPAGLRLEHGPDRRSITQSRKKRSTSSDIGLSGTTTDTIYLYEARNVQRGQFFTPRPTCDRHISWRMIAAVNGTATPKSSRARVGIVVIRLGPSSSGCRKAESRY